MVDRARVHIKAGDGGDGVVHFRREKFIPKGGPDGGDGGRGGSVYLETDQNLSTLEQFAFKQKFAADSGRPGGGKRSTGASATDLIIKVPVGTVVVWMATDKEERVIDLDKPEIRILLAKGGKGGRGNWHFKSSTNTTPRQSEPGQKAEEGWLEMELKLLADVGLIGLPNVGKSTLLSVLSSARPKIADYEFTTLEPNLGVLKIMNERPISLVIADIPGLIEGASKGKGLGIQFLQHIERTRVLVHVLAVKSEEETGGVDVELIVNDLWKSYQTVRDELATYEASLVQKPEIIVLNKIDLLSEELVDQIIEALSEKGIKVLPISCGTLAGIDELKKRLAALAV